ncbi:LAQU0S22e01068g1_1 [Lachancea quebecensis]|uniref:LAQU0S22e01068g1_1 n=1 Tax=Lachancea quebecensis TaxID=1654605 RepID=A0A0P1KZR7_9SACH|nr:LAQU0S22e01068g1_1 [Lachancea quebecensis]
MALHNYIYLKHKSHDPECHTLIARDHDNRPLPQERMLPQASRAAPVASELTTKTANRAASKAKTVKANKEECCGDCQGKCDTLQW